METETPETDGIAAAVAAAPVDRPPPAYDPGAFAGKGDVNFVDEIHDPEIHESPPRKNRDGKWAKLRGKRPASVSARLQGGDEGGQLQRREAAERLVALIVAVGMNVFGTEWTPIKDASSGIDEQAGMNAAFEDYFRATGIIDVPPGLALCMAMGAYCLPRFAMPHTRAKMGSIVSTVRRRKKINGESHEK